MTSNRMIDALKPFLWIGFVAYLGGFAGYLALAQNPSGGSVSPIFEAGYAPVAQAGPPRAV